MADTRFDKIQKVLFTSPEDTRIVLSDKDLEIKQRYEKVFTYWINNPELPERRIVHFLQHECGVAKSVAYEDLRRIKRLLGNVQLASKEFYRHTVIEMCTAAFRMAKAAGDTKAMVMAADKLGKYTKLDKDEAEALPWDQLIPPNFEPDPDISILGFTPDENIEQKRQRLRDKYLQKYDPGHQVEDAVIIED